MSSDYVKKFNCGNLVFDLPYSNLLYEVPLMMFKDMRNGFELSLVYNRQMSSIYDNPFNICNGFKLNVQKKLIINGNDVSLLDSNGKRINLTKNGQFYTFSDESKRIMWFNGQYYTIEYFDYSREIFDSSGNLIETYDKYEDLILKYNYNGNLLSYIDFKNNSSKRVSFTYSNQKLSSITYSGNSGASINFSYSNDGINVTHYSGVIYNITYSNSDFDAQVSGTDNIYTYNKKCVIDSNHDWIATISDWIDNDLINSYTYTFEPNVINVDQKSSQIVIADYHGVKIRQQYIGEKLAYAYEVTDSEYDTIELQQDRCLNNIQTIYTIDEMYNKNSRYIQNYSNGIYLEPVNNIWRFVPSDLSDTSNLVGEYIISGWIKLKDSFDDKNSTTGFLKTSDTAVEQSFEIFGIRKNSWTFFSSKFSWGSNDIIFTIEALGFFDVADVKIIPIVKIKKNENQFFAPYEEDVLIQKNDVNNIIPLQKIAFDALDNLGSDYWVSFDDIFRYKLNHKKGTHLNYFYYNNNKNILTGSAGTNVQFKYNNQSLPLSDYYVGKRCYTAKGEILIRYDDSSSDYLIIENIDSYGVVKSSTKLNDYLDVIELYSDNNTQYFTKDKSLDTKIELGNIVKEYSYDEINGIITETDEFGKNFKYYYDTTWGTLIKIELPNNKTIINIYDQDNQTLLQKTFKTPTTETNHSFNYEGGYLNSVNNDAVTYFFNYDGGELINVNRDNSRIEDHVHTTNQTTSYYPSQSSPLYSFVKNYDKYERLTSVNNNSSYIYDVVPTFDSNSGEHISYANNSSAVLARYNDLVEGTVTRYTYEHYDKIKNITTTKTNFSNKISTENFGYNDYSQLNNYSYQSHNLNQTFTSTIEYDNSFNPDNSVSEITDRVKKYEYQIDNGNGVETNYEFDLYKRVTDEIIQLDKGSDSNKFTNNIDYCKTRINKYMHLFNDSLFSFNQYTYDSLGRIETDVYAKGSVTSNKRYKYDVLGQLIREDNQELNKTFVYNYDSYGNLTNIKKYNYTLSETLTSSYTIDTFVYNSTNKYKLDQFNNKSISYDSNGNITSYNGYSYTWSKNKLTKISTLPTITRAIGVPASNIKTYDFTYNAKGQRTKITYTRLDSSSSINPILPSETKSFIKEFYYDSFNRLIAEKKTEILYDNTLVDTSISYLYSKNNIIGIEYTSFNQTNKYYFERNIQNDVIGIYDDNCNMVVKYNYDACGNCTIDSETTNVALANANPIRYRGYYYDRETQLFYCNSRYYSPELCRFISPDGIEYLDPESINGLNLYCYCMNNPIMYADPSGCLPQWAMWLIGGVVIAGLAIATIATGGAAGGVAGFILAGALKGAVVGAVSGALVNGAISGISSAIDGDGFWSGFADGAAHGFMSGAVIGGITGAISSGLQVAKAASYWDKGTFSSGYKSMKYHYTQEVVNKGLTKGNSIVKYTSDAVKFANNNGMNFTLNLSRNGLQNSWSLSRYFGSGANGLYTSSGNIITFHYFYMW